LSLYATDVSVNLPDTAGTAQVFAEFGVVRELLPSLGEVYTVDESTLGDDIPYAAAVCRDNFYDAAGEVRAQYLLSTTANERGY
jgi:hypothetical protein